MAFENAKLIWEMKWDADWVTAVSFIGKSRRLAAGNRLGEILIWELPEKLEGDAPPPNLQLEGHDNVITRLRCTQDGESLYSTSYDHDLRHWDMGVEGEGERTVTLNARAIYDSQFNRYKKAPEPIDCKVAIHTHSQVFEGHAEWIQALLLSQDESWLVSGDDAGFVIVRERATGKEVRRWQVKGWVHALALSPDKQRALISERRPLVFDAGKHQAVKIWDAAKGESITDISEGFKKMYISAAAYSLDGKTLVVGRGEEEEGKIWFLEPESGEKRKELKPVHQYGVTEFIFHPDGVHLFSAGRDTVVRIWNVASGELVKELGKPRGGQFKDWIHAISFNHDASLLAAADMAGQVNIWSLFG